MRVYLDDDVLYVEHGPAGAFDVLRYPREFYGLGAAYVLPEDAVELHTADGAVSDVLARVRGALAEVKMSATARRAVDDALDELEPGDES